MKERLPLNKEILVWARKSIGLTIEDVARKIDREAKVIEEWEEGISSPTFSQLERLAFEIYKRPLAVFFFPEVPVEDTPKTEFRTLPETISSELPPEIIKLYRNAKLYQLYLEELFDGEKPVEKSLLDKYSLTTASDLYLFTKELRNELNISMDTQAGWGSTETAFKNWRIAFEEKGIFVFKDAFRNDAYSGFCLFDKKYPVIFVNNTMPDSRQLFTLFHELGHLLLNFGGIDFRNREATRSYEGYFRNIEVTSNLFANLFLVPPEVFDSFQLTVSESQFQNLANYFSVSREVILRNYLDRGLVNNDYYEEMAAKWIKEAKESKVKSDGGIYYYNKKAYLGEKYINLVYSKYYQNKITLDAVAQYLNIKVKNLPTFEYMVVEGGRKK